MILPVFVAALMAAPVMAQDSNSSSNANQPTEPNRDRDRGGRGNFDPQRFREEMAARMKERLGANDEEWKVIEPKLTKVLEARRDTGGFGGFGFRGRGGGDSEGPQSPAQEASRALRETLDNKDASADDIAAKLKAYREARDKAKTDLAAAQKDLKEVLTGRQEAVMVSLGMLD
jgi:Spy/CpxP family protein refolding chaperone